MTDVVPGAINIAASALTSDHIIAVQTPVAAQTTMGAMSTYFTTGAGGTYVPLAGGVTITGALTLSAAGTALTIANNATVTGVLTVTGAATVTGALTANAAGTGLAVKNSATVGADLTVTGKFGANGKAAVGAQTVAGAKLASDVVMASLLTALVAEGLVIDTTT